MTKEKIHGCDVVIVGAGPAGMTAALYAARKKLKTVVVSVDIGGQASITPVIDNYPGFATVGGFELMAKFQAQALKWGAEFVASKIVSLEKKKDGTFLLTASDRTIYSCRAVILAFGKTPKSMNIPGEEKFIGKGVSTCITCDGPLYANVPVAIVGGGNSAVEGAREMANIASKVYVVHKRDHLLASDDEMEKVKRLKNVEILLNTAPVEVKGHKMVDSFIVEDVQTRKHKELKVEGVFVEIGYEIQSRFLKGLVTLNQRNEIIVNEKMETDCPGIFAAGDVTNTPYKQAVSSAGDGCKAAMEAHRYLIGAKSIGIDWS